MERLLGLENISYLSAGSKEKPAKPIITNVSFDIYQGEIVGLAGESGCGKTTLAKIISGILKPSEGTLALQSPDKRKPQLLFQNSDELINPLRKVHDIFSDISDDEKEITSLMTKTGVESELLHKFGYQLSGGQRQRVGLCRLLLSKPGLLILDEPFSAQDAESKLRFSELLKELNKNDGLTILCISHDLATLKDFASRIIIMFGGKIMESGEFTEVMEKPLHPYTKFLKDSSAYLLERKDFANDTSEMNTAGCSYFGRCPKRENICGETANFIRKTELHYSYCNFPLD